MSFHFKKCHFLLISLLSSAYITLIFNLSWWRQLSSLLSSDPKLPAVCLILIPIAFFLLQTGLLTLICAWKWLMRPLLVLFLIISAIAAFAIDNYGIKFDRGMIANFIETNPAEAASYLSFKSICFVLGLGFIPSLAVCLIPVYYPQSWLKQRMQHLGCGALLISAGLALAMPFYQQIVFLGREHKDIIKILVPSACVGAAWSYFEKNYLQKNQPYVALGQDVRKSLSTDKPRLIFLVVGETARAADYEYMGYARDTNRYTRPDDLINFTKVSSCGTATAQSLPCMFSNLNRSEFDTSLTVNREGLMDVIAKSGAKTIWIDNDGGCKGACDRIPNQMIKADEDPKYCNGSTCTDEVPLDANISFRKLLFIGDTENGILLRVQK